MIKLITEIVQALVDHPEQVNVTQVAGDTTQIYEVEVAKADMGQVIGKSGQTASAIRRIVTAIGAKRREHAIVEIIE